MKVNLNKALQEWEESKVDLVIEQKPTLKERTEAALDAVSKLPNEHSDNWGPECISYDLAQQVLDTYGFIQGKGPDWVWDWSEGTEPEIKQVIYRSKLERYIKSAFRRICAKNEGLKYAAVRHFGAGNCNPKLYKIWEDLTMDESGRGAFDSKKVWGLSAYQLDRIFFVCGCKFSTKFFHIIYHILREHRNSGRVGEYADILLKIIRKSHSANDTKHLIRTFKRFGNCAKPKEMIRAGKINDYIVAATYLRSGSRKAHEVQFMSPKEKSRFLPARQAHLYLEAQGIAIPLELGERDHPCGSSEILSYSETSEGGIYSLKNGMIVERFQPAGREYRELIPRKVGEGILAIKIGYTTFVWREEDGFKRHIESQIGLKDALSLLEQRFQLKNYMICLNDVRNDVSGTAGFCLAGVKGFAESKMPFLYRLIQQFKSWDEIPRDIMETKFHLTGPEVFSGYPNPVRNAY